MKHYIFSFLGAGLLLCLQPAQAQNAQKFSVDGISIILKPTVKDIINVSVYYRGGVTNYEADKAGIEGAALAGTAE